MVYLTEPRQLVGHGWKTIDLDGLFNTQSDGGSNFRIVTTGQPPLQIATGDSKEEILKDAELLRLFMVGMAPNDGACVPSWIKSTLHETARQAMDTVTCAPGVPQQLTEGTEWSTPDVVKHLEPWAKTLLDNADNLRYVCYAMKVATSLAADASTAGLGGEELVQTCFVGVDAAIVSSWLTWFTGSVLDQSPESNIIRQTLTLDFSGGPRGVASAADVICAAMRPDDAEKVTKLAMGLKRRLAVLIGDVCSLFIPNDFAIGGAVIAEALIAVNPSGAMDALLKLLGWYELIPSEHRATIEDHGKLMALMHWANGSVRAQVMKEYERPLGQKALNTAKRHVVSFFVPGAIWLQPANLVASAALGANVGKGSCAAVFETLDNVMPEVAATLQRALAIQFGLMCVLAHCADKTSGSNNAFSAATALEMLPRIMEAQRRNGTGGNALVEAGLGLAKKASKVLNR